MAEEALNKAGLHFDELNKIRVLDPEVGQQSNELKEECKAFLDSTYGFVYKFSVGNYLKLKYLK
jgi:intraflagellar transport protein 20